MNGLNPFASTAQANAMQPASWRGVPFGVRDAQVRFGRRQAVHEYPQRDSVWVEDLGRRARRIRFIGFLIENDLAVRQDDLTTQQQRLLTAVEAPGAGELVHPALGRLTASCTQAVVAQRWDQQRVLEIAFEFIESGQQTYPDAALATGQAVNVAATVTDQAVSNDFITRADTLLRGGVAVIDQATHTAARWTRQTQRLADDASSLYRRVYDLPGAFGRYFKGRERGLEAVTHGIQRDMSNVQKLIALGAVGRRNVAQIIGRVLDAAARLGS